MKQKILQVTPDKEGLEVLHKNISDGWLVKIATPVIKDTYVGGSYTTSVIYILEKE